jgi:signal peptidase I
LKVEGWSMLPGEFPEDTLVIESSESNEAVEGDINLFSRDRRLFAHRVVKRVHGAGHELVTRGDAMPVADPVVRESEILGRVVLIQRNGKSIRPTKRMHFTDRAVGAFVRNSGIAARVIVDVHGLRQTSRV